MLALSLGILLLSTRILADCDSTTLPEITFRLTGSNLLWPCQSTKNIFVHSGRYIPKNIIVTRTQLYRDIAFVALPRYKPGVPITLGRINLKRGECYPPIVPFPCWSMQEEGNCHAMQSVVDIYLDVNNVLWALDIGIVNTLEQPVRRCAPKLFAFDVLTGKMVKMVDLSSLVTSKSRLQSLVVDIDIKGKGFVYISDAGTGAILVHNIDLKTSHRVVLPPTIADCNKTDVLQIVLVQKTKESKALYLSYLGSSKIYFIKAEHLRLGLGSGAVVDVGSKPDNRQIVLLGTDNGPGLYLRYKGESEIFLWNTETAFKPSNFIEAQGGGDCRLATHVVPGHKTFMWALESNFQDFISNTCGCNGPSITLHPLVKDCDD